MIALYLLAAHMVGDYVLQSRRMAAHKFADPRIRAEHVCLYVLPFIPVAVWALWPHDQAAFSWRLLGFLVALWVLHFLTDSRRLRSSLMDWLEWLPTRPGLDAPCPSCGVIPGRPHLAECRRSNFGTPPRIWEPVGMRLKPNPWTPLPILTDQTLHLCQIAVLAGVFLT